MRTRSRFCAAFAVFALAVGLGAPEPVSAQQQLREESVRTFMDYAWALTPAKFTTPDGKSILIDRAKRDEMTVPVDDARKIILVGRLTAHAQMCELGEHQVLNYQSLMRRERRSKKWSDQQLVFINQLHLTTVMLLTGQIKLVEKKDGGKDVVVYEGKKPNKTCTDEQRAKVKELIDAYLASENKDEKKQG
jgi:hypothetical protein